MTVIFRIVCNYLIVVTNRIWCGCVSVCVCHATIVEVLDLENSLLVDRSIFQQYTSCSYIMSLKQGQG